MVGFIMGLFCGALGGFVIAGFLFLDYLEDNDDGKHK
jgi:hypothetical protein